LAIFAVGVKAARMPKSASRVGTYKQLRPTRIRDRKMYTLNFPNGNSQTYKTQGELMQAARAMGGTAKCVGGKVFAFVPGK